MNNTPPPGRGRRYEGNYELDVLLDKEQSKRLDSYCAGAKPTLLTYEEDRQASNGYVKCYSCNQYFPGSHPEHGYTMCEDCVG